MESSNFAEQPLPADKPRAHVVAFTSGKGGVGKTCVTANVATAMAQKGARVCIFDADTGLANINILLGLRPEFTLEHVLNGEKSLRDIVVKTRQGVAVVPGATGIASLADLDADTCNRLSKALTELEADYDYFLIDTAAGVADSVLQFIESAPHAFLLITPEPTSLTDGFSMLKLLNNRQYPGSIRVLVNMVEHYQHATETYRRFYAAVNKYLDLNVDYGGFVARDDGLAQSIVKQTPLVELFGNAPASRCLFALADNLLKHVGGRESEVGLADYWQNVARETANLQPTGNRHNQAKDQALQAGPVSQAPDLTAPESGIAELAEQLLTAMQNQSADRQMLEDFSGRFMAGFQGRFGRFPANFRTLLFRWLEAEDYAAPQLQELAGTLEALYMAKHRQPLHDAENGLARLIVQCKDSETEMRALATQMREAYLLAFGGDVFDARRELLEAIQKPAFSEAHYQELLDDLGRAFEQRFKRPYRSKSDLLLASTMQSLADMADEELKLREQADELSNGFRQLNQRRAALLAAVKPE
ncbi:MinD/ParA family protein [Methylomonas sp. SURF-2]|uniref:MinD/ParA family protein n=1 Tax=Methylomonas subterranea TaxID=2952225 RepID=A0ABT1TCF2_9GAMM|nr:MinD/ParA family protein [Methylomonas sp. SURF-2]MCQ8103130.1 MinD/ParA family protein [Methylomonas sp. SURF-2]